MGVEIAHGLTLAPARGRRLRRRLVYRRDVVLHLVGRELAARYRRSLLGWIWSLAPPLAQLAVFNFVFTRVIPLKVPHFALFLLTGILTWNWLSTSLVLASGSIEARRHLVLRPGFPTPLIPVVAAVVGLADYLFALPVLLVAAMVTIGPSAAMLLLPALIAIQLLLVIGIGWMLAPLQVFFRDVTHLVGIALLLGFYLTPVFYARGPSLHRFHLVYELNPMTHLIEGQRAVLLDGHLPTAASLFGVAAASVAICALGFAVFGSLRHSLPDQL